MVLLTVRAFNLYYMILSNTLINWSKIVKNSYSDTIHEYYVIGFESYIQGDKSNHFYSRDLHNTILEQAIKDVNNI